MLLPKYKNMDGEVIVVVLQQESFFSKIWKRFKRKRKKRRRRRGKREFGLKKKGGRVVFKCEIESGIFLNSTWIEHEIIFKFEFEK